MQEPSPGRESELGSNEFLVLCAAATIYYGLFFDLGLFEAAIWGLRG